LLSTRLKEEFDDREKEVPITLTLKMHTKSDHPLKTRNRIEEALNLEEIGIDNRCISPSALSQVTSEQISQAFII